MSLEKFDTQDVNGVQQNKGLRLRGFATSSGAPYTPSEESNGQLKEMRTRSRLSRNSRETLNRSL